MYSRRKTKKLVKDDLNARLNLFLSSIGGLSLRTTILGNGVFKSGKT